MMCSMCWRDAHIYCLGWWYGIILGDRIVCDCPCHHAEIVRAYLENEENP